MRVGVPSMSAADKEALVAYEGEGVMRAGVLRVAPLAGETTWSLLCRVAARYRMDVSDLRTCWEWRNQPPRAAGIPGVRPDAEVVLNRAGQDALARLCRVGPHSLERALPSWSAGPQMFKGPADSTRPLARWQVGATASGPVAFGCRLCTARRTGEATTAMRYRSGWQRVCERHQRWLLDADGSHGLEQLDLSQCPDIAAAQRRWPGVVRRAERAAAEPGQVFAMAHAVVCAWWELALYWDQERIWPARLHLLAGGDASGDLSRWRAIGRDAVILPEVVEVADALLDPAMAELVWRDSGAEHPRPLPAGGAFCRELGVRVGRPWLGPLVATDYGGPLTAWIGLVIRRRSGMKAPEGYADDPWRLKQEHRPTTAAGQLRKLAQNAAAAGSGTAWRSAVPAERRAVITALVAEATDDLTGLRGAQIGSAREAGHRLLQTLTRTTGLLQQALHETTAAALQAGIPVEDLAEWTGQPVTVLERYLTEHQSNDHSDQ